MLNLSRIADETGLTLIECRNYRIEYLRQHIRELAEDVTYLADDAGELSADFCQSIFQQLLVESKELRSLTIISKPNYRPRAGAITPQMIEDARDYPIEQIVQFDRQGKSLAWCHADNHPSLSWHRAGNRATCFPCGKIFNPIDVLTQRDGMSFPDAVKQLTR
jgi:hypothetical protein